MKRIIILSLLLLQSSFVYAIDFSDTDNMYGWNGSSQFFPLWSDHKTQLESELSFLSDAPSDGTAYVRQNGSWIDVQTGLGTFNLLGDESALLINTGVDYTTLFRKKYIEGTENDYIGTLLNINGIYDLDSTNHAVTIDNKVPAAFTITEISISCDADPTTEQTLTFYHKAAGVGYGTPTTIEAVTTTAGVATVTTGFDDATIPADVKLFMVLSDPDAALFECSWRIEGDFD